MTTQKAPGTNGTEGSQITDILARIQTGLQDKPDACEAVGNELLKVLREQNSNDDGPAGENPPYRLTTLSTVEPEKVEWLWPGHLPKGKCVGLVGDPSQGKSTVACDIAAHITTGATWPDGSPGCAPGACLILSAEDGRADTTVPRLLAAGGDTSRVHTLDAVPVRRDNGEVSYVPPMLPEALEVIEQAIKDKHVTLVVVDVLMGYLSGSVNSYRDQDIRAQVMGPLSEMAERTGSTFLLLRHPNKAQGGSAVTRAGGSIGITGAERAEFVIGSDTDNPDAHVFAPVKFNLGRQPRALSFELTDDPEHECARVTWGKELDVTADQLVNRQPETEDERAERNECQEFVVGYLSERGGDASASAVIKEGRKEGFNDKQIKNARYRCRNPRIEAIKKDASGWVWSIVMDKPEPNKSRSQSTTSLTISRDLETLRPSQVDGDIQGLTHTKVSRSQTIEDSAILPPSGQDDCIDSDSRCISKLSNEELYRRAGGVA